MKQILRIIVIALSLSSIGSTKPMEPTTIWHATQTAAGSTMGLILCVALKHYFKPKESLQQAPVQQNPTQVATAAKPRVRLAPVFKPKKQSPKINRSSQSTSASSDSQSAPTLFTQREPQISCMQQFKKLPRTCLQALSMQSIMQTWVFAVAAITSYTTASAGIQGLAADLGY